MKKAIYKIENLINHKIYIGQSLNPERRWSEHCYGNNYVSLISRAIKKYGNDNFSFEILGWFENYNEKEKYYINLYKSLVPYGYNIQQGGEEPPHYKGEQNPSSIITQQQADKIINQLKKWQIPFKTIVANNKVTRDIVRHINEGDTWRKENESYPLRPSEEIIEQYRTQYVRYLCICSNIPLNQIGSKVGRGRSYAKMINSGNNHYDERFTYPLRNNKEVNKQILEQEACTDYLHLGE